MITKFSHTRYHPKGFTIIELLIVIVVIAILAAITIVAYNGVQQRANNAAIIDAASKSLRMVQAYIATNNAYPIVGTDFWSCITSTSGCAIAQAAIGANSTFDTNMGTIGKLPRTTPVWGANRYGVNYNYSSTRTLNGQAQPAILLYYLTGTSQPCGVAGVTDGTGPVMLTSVSAYSAADAGGSGKTACVISIPGPSA